MTPASRSKYFPVESEPPDILLVVDCVYNPSLVPPLTEAMSYFAGDQTTVIVFMELRSEDVTQEFLASWMQSGAWIIWRIPHSTIHPRYVLWVGWKGVA